MPETSVEFHKSVETLETDLKAVRQIDTVGRNALDVLITFSDTVLLQAIDILLPEEVRQRYRALEQKKANGEPITGESQSFLDTKRELITKTTIGFNDQDNSKSLVHQANNELRLNANIALGIAKLDPKNGKKLKEAEDAIHTYRQFNFDIALLHSKQAQEKLSKPLKAA